MGVHRDGWPNVGMSLVNKSSNLENVERKCGIGARYKAYGVSYSFPEKHRGKA